VAFEGNAVDAEPGREPDEGGLGRPRLAQLDLADVLLREAVAAEVGLGQARARAERAHARAHARGRAIRAEARGRLRGDGA
jgi:hypothetical protein